jgi:translation initiation factor 3 subunit F
VEVLERGIEQVLDMLERVSNYVSNVLDEEAEPSSALGQFLMNTLSLAPKVDAEEIEKDLYVSIQPPIFSMSVLLILIYSNNHIQDILLISYLSNTIRTQIDLSNRLATAALTMGSGNPEGASGEGGDRRQGGQRRDNREGGDRRQQGARRDGGRGEQ